MDFSSQVEAAKNCLNTFFPEVHKAYFMPDPRYCSGGSAHHWAALILRPMEQGHLCYVHLKDAPDSYHEVLFRERDGLALHEMYVTPQGQELMGPWFFDSGAAPSDLAKTIVECLHACVRDRPQITKVWTLREACEQNKTRQRCCVCGKPTVRMALCLTAVQYCRCVEQLGK